ncbi:hypothetical protein LTR16_002493 [Cryomyces antarcticus]|uniref:Uncharacterized protein n=1 Tax=Cryomyces antarcticus TaxID=329879 RepID=A0ABR0LPN0_9PEZI|nr:hypothetical protein LTR16_002493 [Cryomyces antarcticus]
MPTVTLPQQQQQQQQPPPPPPPAKTPAASSYTTSSSSASPAPPTAPTSASASSPPEPPTSSSFSFSHRDSRSSSPVRPPVSPLTPVATLASLAPISGSRIIPPGGDDDDRRHDDSHDESHQPAPHPPATFIPRPAPLPFEQSSNTDVVALRATISLLQIQRDKAKRDILALQKIKDRAATDPAAYLRAVQAGSVVSSNTHDGILGPTLTMYDFDDDDPDDPDARHTASAEAEVADSTDTSPVSSFSTTHSTAPPPTTAFPPVPSPQNIVRMPPINWAKYAIAGAPLDALHAEAQRRPDFARAPDHVFAAPWSPFADRADDDLRRDSAYGGRGPAGHGGGGGGGAGEPAGGGTGGEVVHPMQTRRGSKKV